MKEAVKTDLKVLPTDSDCWLKETFLGDTLTCRLILLSNETDEAVYHYLHTIARNDCETAAQVYSE